MSRSHIGFQKAHLFIQKNLCSELQSIVNNVIEGYFNINEQDRNAYHVLLLIAEHWKKVNVDHFSRSTDYYTVLAKTTDTLLKGLSYNEGGSSHLINDQLVIMNQLANDNGMRATVFLMETNQQESGVICNQIKKYLVKKGTTGLLYISIYSLVDGNVYKLYDRK
ncbi:hypothetical protein [Alkalihalobacterium sp. APHAB7]|uniref:hypothetical protein n=1 Tax=Alkalihalobacterium sp. APHAB7 TaxID=3402081 RepID=UPI003AAFDE0C